MYDLGKADCPDLDPMTSGRRTSDPDSAGAASAAGLARSQTDTNISYKQEEVVHEVAGAIHYIQKNGYLNYKVILQVCMWVFFGGGWC